MGNEASVPAQADGSTATAGGDPFNAWANVKIQPKEVRPLTPPMPASPPMASPTQRPRTTAYGLRGSSEGGFGALASMTLDIQPKRISQRPVSRETLQKERGWRTGNNAISAPTEVRRARTAVGGRRDPLRSSLPTLAEQMGAMLKTEPKPALPSLEQKMEERKTELIGKLSNFISSAPKLPTEGPRMMAIPAPKPSPGALSGTAKANWMNKLLKSRQAMQEAIKEKLGQPGATPAYEPMTQEGVGGEVEKSLGPTYATFAGFQGTINHMMETGLSEELLEQFFMDEEAEQQLTTYQKWSVIRHAAEQVLQVYANRSNSSAVESEDWVTPRVLDTRSGAAAAYVNTVEGALNQGQVCLMLVDDGRLLEKEAGPSDPGALLPTDLWQVIKATCPHKVPSGQRLERLSVMGRHLLAATVSLETRFGPAASKALKVVLAIDCEQEAFAVAELQRWSFFGLNPAHVVLLPLPRFHGFCHDMKNDKLVHVKGSPRLLLGTGYSLYLLNSPAEGYTIDTTGSPNCLSGSVLEWLREHKANWLSVGLFSDIERLRPDAILDSDFLSGALFCADREGANMVMEVQNCKQERDVRTYNSIILARAADQGVNCALPATAMRTVRSYKLMKEQAASETGFYVSTQRYAFKVAALQKLLTDPASFHADVTLHGFYAYATLDLADLTLIPEARCGCVRPARCSPGPAMSDVMFNKNWHVFAAGVLEEQDKVDVFRQKAIDLIKMDKLSNSMGRIAGAPADLLKPGQLHTRSSFKDKDPAAVHETPAATSPGFKERKTGLGVVLLLSAEHRGVAGSAMRLARLFIRNIVDRLHVVLLLGSAEKEASAGQQMDTINQVMDEVVDKELDFNGQLSREVIDRGEKAHETVLAILEKQQAGMVVVPSHKLCGPGVADLGNTSASLAYAVIKHVNTMPVLVVKANTAGRFVYPNTLPADPTKPNTPTPPGVIPSSVPANWSATNSSRDHVVAMAFMEGTTVAPLVEAVCSKVVTAGRDTLYLAKAQAYERPGLLSMKTRRVFVQARMAATEGLRVEERAYAGHAVQELPKAVEAESVDVLVLNVTGELPIPKDMEDLLKTCKTSVYIHRHKDTSTPTATIQLQVEKEAPVGYAYRNKGAGSTTP